MNKIDKKTVVIGEASESDSDDNENCHQGKVVSGEAPESDDEIYSFTDKETVIDETISENIYSPPINQNSYPESLLAKKLYDANYSFFNHINVFIQTRIVTIMKQIVSADQLLLKSQMTLQAVHGQIQKSNETTGIILEKYQHIVNGDFIPNIRIPK